MRACHKGNRLQDQPGISGPADRTEFCRVKDGQRVDPLGSTISGLRVSIYLQNDLADPQIHCSLDLGKWGVSKSSELYLKIMQKHSKSSKFI